MEKGRVEYSCQSTAVLSRGAHPDEAWTRSAGLGRRGTHARARTHARTAAIVHRNEVNEDGVAPSKGLHIDVNL